MARRADIETNLKAAKLQDIEDILLQLPTSITAFPNKVPKKKAREVYLSVLVLKIQNAPSPESSFLFIKRPNKGLLSNQWEFPNVPFVEEGKRTKDTECSNEKGKKRKLSTLNSTEVVFSNGLLAAFPPYLRDVFGLEWSTADSPSTGSGERRIQPAPGGCDEVINDPIIHLFSHERHIMHVAVKEVVLEGIGDSSGGNWKSLDDREVSSFFHLFILLCTSY